MGISNNNTSVKRRPFLRLASAMGATGLGGLRAMTGSGAAKDPPSSDNTTEFTNLGSAAKNRFEIALDQGEHVAQEYLPLGLRRNEYVEYRGVTYAINTRQWYERRNRIRPKKVSPEEVQDGADVLLHDALPREAKRVFDVAAENGIQEYGNKWFFDFSDDYVRRRGTFYKLRFQHMDFFFSSVKPEKHE